MKLTNEEKTILRRIVYTNNLTDEASEMNKKNFIKAMKKHSEDFSAIVLFILIGAGVVMLAIAGII
jgi:F0F1-type ATP synthase assembly protein I